MKIKDFKNQQTQSKRLMKTFVFSYLMFLILAILVGSIVYIRAESIISEEVKNSKMLMLRQSRNEIDSRFNELQKASFQISMNYSIQGFLNSPKILSASDIYKAVEITRDLKPYKNNNFFIYDFYIFVPKMDKIINSISLYNTEMYYNDYCGYEESTYREWHDIDLYKGIENNYNPPVTMINELWPRRMMSYFQPIPITEKENPTGILVMLIDERQITSRLINLAEQGKTYIIDNDYNIITETNPIKSYDISHINFGSQTEGLLEQTIGGEDMIIAFTSSSVFDWKYVTVLSKDIFLDPVNEIKIITLWIVGLYLILGSLIAIYLSYRNYHPIKLIFDVLSSHSNETLPFVDELDYIKKAVDIKLYEYNKLEQINKDITLKNNEISHLKNRNSPIIRNSLLNKLATGKVADIVEFENYLKLYDIRFPFPMFSMGLYYIGQKNHSDLKDNRLELIRYIIATVFNTISGENYENQIFEYKNESIGVIFNTREQDNYDEAKQRMINISSKVIQLLEEKMGISVSVGISNVYEGLLNLSKACIDANKALEYRIIKGGNAIICFDEIITRDREYYYPIKHELQLINSVRSGNISKCESLLDSIFTENFEKRTLPIDLVNCLFFDIMSTAIKTLESISINYLQIFGEDYEPLDRITSCETVDEMHHEIIVLYTKICQFIDTNKKSHNNPLCNEIVQYIEDNYADENLCQTQIAQSFHISTAYLSKLFKENTGQNMIDFINGLRVEKAKELLMNTKLTSIIIAEKVGCTNDKNLIRLFKQIDGITPGKYREYINIFKT